MRHTLIIRRTILVAIVAAAAGALLFDWLPEGSMQAQKTGSPSTEEYPSVRAGNAGKPYINFADGIEIDPAGRRSGAAGSPVNGVSGDFDSDGIPDLIVADSGGTLRLYRGMEMASTSGELSTGVNRSFRSAEIAGEIGSTADLMFAGDFNGDGKQDIVAIARGSSDVDLSAGDGQGRFAPVRLIDLNGGSVTAAGAGEIGRPDGQTDLAVAFSNTKGSFLAVYEHPESAFSRSPEIIKLPSAATSIAIGDMDEDAFSDIAVACGSDLVVVHERGQAYPFDLMPASGVKRPAAVVDIRRMPFEIASVVVGRFGLRHGTSLAVLGSDGGVYRIGPSGVRAPSNVTTTPAARQNSVPAPFVPSGADAGGLADLADPPRTGELAGMMKRELFDVDDIKAGRFGELLQKRDQQKPLPRAKVPADEKARRSAATAAKRAEYRNRAIEAFEKSLAPRTTALSGWTIERLSPGSEFADSAGGGAILRRVNVSDSPLDDISVAGGGAGKIQFLSRVGPVETGPRSITSEIDVDDTVVAAIPMRLNADALDDMIVLRRGSPTPVAVMSAPASTITVTSSDDNGDCQGADPCSLRSAILKANGSGGTDSIVFSLGGPSTIAPMSELPIITDSVTIAGPVNGAFQPTVEIAGTNLTGQSVDGLKIRTSNVSISGLAVNRFTSVLQGTSQVGGNGITIESTVDSPNNGNDQILDCYLGTDMTGSIDRGNDAVGLNIFDADQNIVGGTSAATRNVISGNGSHSKPGAGIAITAGDHNTLSGNYIGINSSGNGKIGNSEGIFLAGASNTIGGDAPGAGNSISGNGETRPPDDPQPGCDGYGISVNKLIDVNTHMLLTANNTVSGNRMGTDPSGLNPLGNCSAAIGASPVTMTQIGSITQNGRNVISDNGLDAVECSEFPDSDGVIASGGYCSIAGNNIGTDINGNYAIPNDWRNHRGGFDFITSIVEIDNDLTFSHVGNAGGVTPGGPCTGLCNLISGNGFPGIGILRAGYGTVGIYSNYIGTDQSGNLAIPNDDGGISESNILGETDIGLGIPGVPLGNVISGNQTGIYTGSGGPGGGLFSSSFIQANYIGTNSGGSASAQPDPTASKPGSTGIYVNVQDGDGTIVGGSDAGQGNVISGQKGSTNINPGNGMIVFGNGGLTAVTGNLIGPTAQRAPLGNQGNGINATGPGLQIGGSQANANEIAYNGSAGHQYAGVLLTDGSYGDTIRQNSIHDNIGLGIDLIPEEIFAQGDGPTPNDCLDPDYGANELQNYPYLFTPTVNQDSTVNITGYLRSKGAENYTIDFYSNAAPDPSNYGEGGTFLGTSNVRTSGNGFVSFSFTTATPSTATNITATATDMNGNTSEFSCVAGLCADAARTREEADVMYAMSVCTDPIVVTTTGDEDDADINDGECDVDTDMPGQQCTLRAAIEEAEHQPGANVIDFNIPGGAGQVITPASPLPQMDHPLAIDATSQPGYSGVPVVELNGSGTSGAYGLKLAGGQSLVRGLAIVNFKEGIGLSGGATGLGENRISGNFIGLHLDGTPGNEPRQTFGVTVVNGGTNNQIGGTDPLDRNIISGNETGVNIVSASTNNSVLGNYIGTDPSGTRAVPNDVGVEVAASASNKIGGTIDSGGNVISASTVDDVLLDSGANKTVVSGNLIGTDLTGQNELGGHRGIHILDGATGNLIGGTTDASRNVISGQDFDANSIGVLIGPDAGVSNQIEGNLIGTSKDRTVALPNRVGIAINADSQIVGSSNPADARNFILSSDNEGAYGIYLHPFSPNDELNDVVVENNDVGADPLGQAAAGNIGIFLLDDVKSALITGNTVGSQSMAGIRLLGGPNNNTISNNSVGLSPSGNPIPNFYGIVIKQSDTNFVKDNLVSGNTSHGIVIGDGFGDNDRPAKFGKLERPTGASSFAIENVVTGNKVGTDSSGNFAVPNGDAAIGIGANARNNTIGGPGALANVAGGSVGDFGIGIFVGIIDDSQPQDIFPQGNTVAGNRVGVGISAYGTSIPNRYGIYVRNAVGTVVGGADDASGNIVGNSQVDGIRLFMPGTVDTTIEHNYVGVSPAGDLIPNGGDGISIDGTGAVTVSYNSIGGNLANGIHAANLGGSSRPRRPADGQPSVSIFGNLVGIVKNIAGELVPVPNQLDGVLFENVFNGLIGILNDTLAANKNVVSGNLGNGVSIVGGMENTITDCVVGTDLTGAAGLGNQRDGVKITDSAQNTVGAPNPDPQTILANIISGNSEIGVLLQGSGSTNNSLIGNLIGVFPSGSSTVKLPNGIGVQLQNAFATTVGGTIGPAVRNMISGNNGPGVIFKNAFSNMVLGNLIGTDDTGDADLGNTGDGVLISESSGNNQIGNDQPGAGNEIAFNGGAGVDLDPSAGAGNLIDPNSIHGNTGLGVDLGGDGPTPNDPGDADDGPNRLQNYPVISGSSVDPNSGDLMITYSIDSDPAFSDYGDRGLYAEFFVAGIDGQGKMFLGSDLFTSDDFNSGSPKTIDLGNAAALGYVDGLLITSTATDVDNDTSEFSPVLAPTAAGVGIAGEVVDSAGRPIPRAVVEVRNDRGIVRRSLTNPFGHFSVDDLEAGESYVLSISHKSYTFHSRIVSLEDGITDLTITADP